MLFGGVSLPNQRFVLFGEEGVGVGNGLGFVGPRFGRLLLRCLDLVVVFVGLLWGDVFLVLLILVCHGLFHFLTLRLFRALLRLCWRGRLGQLLGLCLPHLTFLGDSLLVISDNPFFVLSFGYSVV